MVEKQKRKIFLEGSINFLLLTRVLILISTRVATEQAGPDTVERAFAEAIRVVRGGRGGGITAAI